MDAGQMNINRKINAKGNAKVFYSIWGERDLNSLIKRNYKYPYQNQFLPDRLYLDNQFNSNYKGH